jgi:hypothetical protein
MLRASTGAGGVRFKPPPVVRNRAMIPPSTRIGTSTIPIIFKLARAGLLLETVSSAMGHL